MKRERERESERKRGREREILINFKILKSDFDRAPIKTPSLPKKRSKSDKN